MDFPSLWSNYRSSRPLLVSFVFEGYGIPIATGSNSPTGLALTHELSGTMEGLRWKRGRRCASTYWSRNVRFRGGRKVRLTTLPLQGGNIPRNESGVILFWFRNMHLRERIGMTPSEKISGVEITPIQGRRFLQGKRYRKMSNYSYRRYKGYLRMQQLNEYSRPYALQQFRPGPFRFNVLNISSCHRSNLPLEVIALMTTCF